MGSTYFPVFLDLLGAPVLVVGSGPEAEARVESLLRVGARITVVAPHAGPVLHQLSEENRLRWKPKAYDVGDLEEPTVVFAADPDPVLQHRVCQDARALGVWVHRSDEPADSSFQVPQVFERGKIQVAFASPGAAPAMMSRLAQAVAQAAGHELATLGEWLSEPGTGATLRIPDEEFRNLLSQAVVESDVPDLLREGRLAEARARFEAVRRSCEASWSA